jgi:large conductance mechanosensitive channel
MKKLWGEFIAFVMNGNVLLVAVAFVLGLLTKQVIDSFVNNIINPFLAIFGGKPNFDDFDITINDAVIRWGAFVTTLVNLLITGLVLFAIVKAYDTYRERKKAKGEEPEEPSEELLVLREIRDALQARS